jgi:hypothetical protein
MFLGAVSALKYTRHIGCAECVLAPECFSEQVWHIGCAKRLLGVTSASKCTRHIGCAACGLESECAAEQPWHIGWVFRCVPAGLPLHVTSGGCRIVGMCIRDVNGLHKM